MYSKQEDYEKLAPKNLDEAFAMRYELVTKDNVDKMIEDNLVYEG